MEQELRLAEQNEREESTHDQIHANEIRDQVNTDSVDQGRPKRIRTKSVTQRHWDSSGPANKPVVFLDDEEDIYNNMEPAFEEDESRQVRDEDEQG